MTSAEAADGPKRKKYFSFFLMETNRPALDFLLKISRKREKSAYPSAHLSPYTLLKGIVSRD
jgi:hypothetical protein